MPRILITGASGQLGFELQRALCLFGELRCPGRQRLNLANPTAVLAWLDAERPDIIVNAAAYTAVDQAESEPALAHAINADTPAALAQWAAANDALLLHYSTDYVFDGSGETPWREDDAARPLSVYGHSKWLGEEAVRASGCRHFILRTSWLAGVHGGNFLKTMLQLAASREQLQVVDDQFGSPTPASLLADVSAQLLARSLVDNQQPYGSYHVASQGCTSWHRYASFVIGLAREAGWQLALPPDGLLAIPAADYPQQAQRPAYSVLDCSKLQRTFGLQLPGWQQAVQHLFATLDDAGKW
ncbi:dTDP-4-dehydrorhamnose reductase [Vogesella sp. LIG4]|uniref:dTDP-4-dehydrorhamnose reductase n=1 Tax=Vogesella sp. LIG4 TaxID=1192162 RepID=UPI00082023D2|nr:dTDP-4-dehydrorhamnose reductase [Vogesella sp. LIG4]SCK22056.1 dTDP-4-dehydrorhamnose reductase [Vogesella sp. LIG4]